MLIESARQQYNAGAPQITFLYQNVRDLSAIASVMDRYAGFELHEQDERRVVYKDFFDQNLIDEREVLQKMSFLLKTILRELAEASRSHGSHPDIATPRQYLDALRKQGRLLERHFLRSRQVSRDRFTVFLASRSFVKIGAFFLEFLELLTVLDEQQMMRFVTPKFQKFSVLYDRVSRSFFDDQRDVAARLKEDLLGETDRLQGEIMGAPDVLLALSLTLLKNVLHELVRITELGVLVAEL